MNPACAFIQASLIGAVLLIAGSLNASGGSIQDVKHVVVLMQENRSFDHYFGTLQGVRGYQDPNIYVLQDGYSCLFQSNGTNGYLLPFHLTTTCNYHFMGYQTRTNIPFYYALADAYTICDNYFSSFYGPTFPNRLFLFTGMNDPNGTGGGPSVGNTVPTNGFSWTTYPERLQAAGVSWKVYRPSGDDFGDALAWFAQFKNSAPGNPLYDRGMATVNDVVSAFVADVTNGTLPQVSWVIPPSSYSEHQPLSAERGEWFVNQIRTALTANPAVFNSTVLILNYDENGPYIDHALRPVPNAGTPDELGWYGFGNRVPMIVISPWTRGGRVCSQMFDHTSIIRFLETWTGVQETNISAWRRQLCGDLTSVFDFAHPDFSLPNLPVTLLLDCSGTSVSPPVTQSMPVQESGVRPACPLPYQPDARCFTDCSNHLYVTLTNAGAASAHFVLSANAYRNPELWQRDVLPGGSVTDTFIQPNGANGRYDFTCYGPNGFQRRFAGNLNQDCGRIEITSQIDPIAECITLGLLNPAATAGSFTLTNNFTPDSPLVFNLSPASSTNCTFFTQTNQNWYDLTVTSGADASFLRHLVGHIENGAFSFTQLPAIVGNPLLISTNTPPVSTNSPAGPTNSITNVVNQLIIQNHSVSPGTNLLMLSIGAFATNYALVYPGWASNYVLEFNSSLTTTGWIQPAAAAIIISNFNVIILPETNAAGYFRLRH